jgi:Delta3-Delta2-enoyl-CoA isomerase
MGYLKVERKAGAYAVVALCREPVNTLDLPMWQQLKETLTELESDPGVQGVIFTSGLQRDVFTAGNDLLELYAPKTSEQRCASHSLSWLPLL